MSATVVITGANRGLGLALARVHAARGDVVVGGTRTPVSAAELTALGAEVHPLDTADFDSIATFAAAVGDRPVHVLYNSAGVDARAFGADDANRGALTISGANFESVLRVNVTGPLLVLQSLVANLRTARGKVINVSSQVGSIEIAHRIGRDVSYTASKAALNMVTLKQSQALAADGVTVIALHPGFLRTDMGGAGADLDPEDAAAQIVATVDALTPDRTGSFLCWDGSTHPW